MMYWDGRGGGGWIAGLTMMILFWGGITALIWVGVRALGNRPPQPGPTSLEAPRDILADRLARGEIEPEEFSRRLELLSGRK